MVLPIVHRCGLVLGDIVFIEISIISVLLSRYNNNHDNYMIGVMNITKSVHLHIIMQKYKFVYIFRKESVSFVGKYIACCRKCFF